MLCVMLDPKYKNLRLTYSFIGYVQANINILIFFCYVLELAMEHLVLVFLKCKLVVKKPILLKIK
jgi:hypothetical protein